MKAIEKMLDKMDGLNIEVQNSLKKAEESISRAATVLKKEIKKSLEITEGQNYDSTNYTVRKRKL